MLFASGCASVMRHRNNLALAFHGHWLRSGAFYLADAEAKGAQCGVRPTLRPHRGTAAHRRIAVSRAE
jgi:hypothetical protein